eukprot:Rhum_TRINITY_DN3673_c0_g1::Rhum_TRINITY_DN3673_c0_g1_i1::g.11574::m.11574/K08501/STX8; syntaxin 8
MSDWDARYSTLRSDLRAAQREADTLIDAPADLSPAALTRRRATLRTSLHELDKTLKALSDEAAVMEPMDLRQDYVRKVEVCREQRRAILESIGQTMPGSGGGVLAGIRRAIGFEQRKEEEAEVMFDDRDDEQLLDLQNQAIVEQDEALDRLHNVIVRQKKVGQAIGAELDTQVDILDQLETGVQRSTNAIRVENRRMDSIIGAKSDSRLTCLIFLLLVAFALVVILALS